MKKTRTCPECNAELPAGVDRIFCPACAMARALEVGGPVGFVPSRGGRLSTAWIWLTTRLSRLRGGKASEGSPETGLAASEDKGRECGSMSEAALKPGDLIGDYEI